MRAKNYYEGVQDVVQISTNVERSCMHCSEWIGGSDKLAESINHYIKEHDYKLLHVGMETTTAVDGNPWQCTVAVLGK